MNKPAEAKETLFAAEQKENGKREVTRDSGRMYLVVLSAVLRVVLTVIAIAFALLPPYTVSPQIGP